MRRPIQVHDDALELGVALDRLDPHVGADTALAVSFVRDRADPVIVAVDPDKSAVDLGGKSMGPSEIVGPDRCLLYTSDAADE